MLVFEIVPYHCVCPPTAAVAVSEDVAGACLKYLSNRRCDNIFEDGSIVVF